MRWCLVWFEWYRFNFWLHPFILDQPLRCELSLYTHTHNVMKRRYSFHENSCLALSQKNETNKNDPQLLGRVIFIYVAGSIQVPFEWQKPNNRNIYRANGGHQSLVWLIWNPKCCCYYKYMLWCTWNCEHSHYYSAPFVTSLVTSAFCTVQHPTNNCNTLLNIAVTPCSLDPVSVMYCNINVTLSTQKTGVTFATFRQPTGNSTEM